MRDEKETYRGAGVDIDEGARLVELIKPLVATTKRSEVVTDLGGFGALFRLDLTRYKKPLLVAGTDGVGTKLKVAFWSGMHHTIGIDLVAMSANDLVVQGAEPLFFLDYFACGKLNVEEAASVIGGIAEGCRQAGCALIGGETAEMPGFYQGGEYDLSGFCVGIVDEDEVIDGRDVRPGDVILGLASNGLHSNGFSLVRRILFDKLGFAPETPIPELDRTVAEELLRPTRIYVKPCLAMARTGHVKAFAHITGGGFFENIPRVLPDGACATIRRDRVPTPGIFTYLQEKGPISENEMFRTFNMGIGMIAVAAPEHVAELIEAAATEGEDILEIGHIESTTQPPHVMIDRT